MLWVRILAKVVFATDDSVASRVWRAVISPPPRYSHTRPNVRIATRAFVVPALLAFAGLTLMPFAVAEAANRTVFAAMDPRTKVLVLRLAYPLALSVAGWIWLAIGLLNATARWRQRMRDEVYLIGERLHNFGERPKPVTVRTT